MTIPFLGEGEVRSRIAKAGDLPAMPKVLQRLMEVLREDAAPAEEIESLVKYDQALLAKILRVANSSRYGFRGRVITPSDAISVIGLEQIRSICLCAYLTDLGFSEHMLHAFEREKLWKHAFVTARLATIIARERPWIGVEQAYVLGLFHDLGRYLMAIEFTEHFRFIEEVAQQRNVPTWCVEPQCGLRHEILGKWLAIKWGLPEELQHVMEYHHMPQQTSCFRPEVTLISLANILTNSREHPVLLSDPFTVAYCSDLLIVEEEWQEYQARMGEIWPEADQFWEILNGKG